MNHLSGQKRQTASHTDSFLDLFVVDDKEENIFDPAYKCRRSFDILVPEGKRFIKYYAPDSYAPNGYIINSDYSIRIFLNLPLTGSDYSYTYARYNENKVVTIRTEFKITSPASTNQATFGAGSGSIIKDRIWFDAILVWSSASAPIIPRVKTTLF